MSEQLFPAMQPELYEPAEESAAPDVDVLWDMDKHIPVFRDGAPVLAQGLEATIGWAARALLTPRLRHEIYTQAYGSELEELIGQGFDPELIQAEAERYVRECLMENENITAVNDITMEMNGDSLSISCTITTKDGEEAALYV